MKHTLPRIAGASLTAIALLLTLTQVAFAAPAAQQAMPGEGTLPYLFGGFAVIWAGFFAYVFYLHRKEREMRREIESLRQQLAERQPRS